jgi:hypothetical protein
VVTHSPLTPVAGVQLPDRGTLVDDSSFHPFGVGKLSTSFGWG